MAKFKEAADRMFKNVFVCKKCKRKIRTTAQKVILKTVKCRNCNGKSLRAVRKLRVAGK